MSEHETPLSVRPASAELAPTLARLHRAAAIAAYGHIFPPEAPPPTHDELLAQWARWLGPDRDLGRRGFIAEEGGALVGVVLAGPDPENPALGHLARLYVAPDRWSRGIGRALYTAAVHHLRSERFTAATLWVLERNERARVWYERLGWRPTGTRKPVYPPGGIDDLQYRLTLVDQHMPPGET